VLLVSAVSGYAPLYKQHLAEVIPDEYIVIFKDSIGEDLLSSELELAMSQYKVMHLYRDSVKGFSARLTKDNLKDIRRNPRVSFVEVNYVVNASACTDAVDVGSWGLTRIAETVMNLDMKYAHPKTAGGDVIAYVIDTGIYLDAQEFQSANGNRATFGFKAEKSWSNGDMNGHGTHVASTIAGNKFGVARLARLVAVKVLGDNGSGSNAGVIAGVNFVAGDRKKKKKTSVANLSLGGGLSQALNAAVNAAVDAGVVVVVAAGNNNGDACLGSPASADKVISVGATDTSNQKDIRAVFSNWSPKCVHIFAPGSNIIAAGIGDPNAESSKSGTSMASPHVAGIAALLLAENPGMSAKEIKDTVLGGATKGQIDMDCEKPCSDSPNLMAFNGCDRHPNK